MDEVQASLNLLEAQVFGEAQAMASVDFDVKYSQNIVKAAPFECPVDIVVKAYIVCNMYRTILLELWPCL